jgi:hypothetical protein
MRCHIAGMLLEAEEGDTAEAHFGEYVGTFVVNDDGLFIKDSDDDQLYSLSSNKRYSDYEKWTGAPNKDNHFAYALKPRGSANGTYFGVSSWYYSEVGGVVLCHYKTVDVEYNIHRLSSFENHVKVGSGYWLAVTIAVKASGSAELGGLLLAGSIIRYPFKVMEQEQIYEASYVCGVRYRANGPSMDIGQWNIRNYHRIGRQFVYEPD